MNTTTVQASQLQQGDTVLVADHPYQVLTAGYTDRQFTLTLTAQGGGHSVLTCGPDNPMALVTR